MENLSKWNNFVKEISNLIFFWIFGIVFFAIYRTSLILIYSSQMRADNDIFEFWKTYHMAFKYDCTVISYFMILPLACALLFSYFNWFKLIRNVRIVCQYLFVILSALMCIITINYFKEYNDQFNQFVFVGLYDDKQAILQTIVEYYNPVTNSIAVILTIVLGILVFKYFEGKTNIYNLLVRIRPIWARGLFVLLAIGLFVCSIRGSFQKAPAIRSWAAVAADPFLNKTIINPYRSLKYAYQDFQELNQIGGDNPYGKDIATSYAQKTVREIIERHTKGNTIDKPKQIFLVIMESYDAWPLSEKYKPFQLSTNLQRIADNGTSFTNFLPSGYATFHAYSTIVSGIPHCGLETSQIALMHEPYMSSIFSQFKKLGYKTNVFYGGFLSWHNLGAFTEHFECDAIYSGANAGGKTESGAWGAEDEKLFDLILEHVDPNEYTFNLVLTSSYHPPYNVDVYKRGFMYRTKDDLPKEAQEVYEDGMNFTELGHLWYGDWAIGRFVDEADKKYNEAVFAFTGDHFGRRIITHTPNLLETSAVPFILYGNNIPKQKVATPGSHINIMPTLIEMIAPENFTYYSFGKSMFDTEQNLGLSFEKAIDSDSLYYSPRQAETSIISLGDNGEKQEPIFRYKDSYSKLMQLAWHYTVRGDSLNVKEQ